MEIKEMKIADVEQRLAEIMQRRSGMADELEKENADIDALSVEADQLNEEEEALNARKKEILEAAEARKKDLKNALDSAKVSVDFEKEERKKMTDIEVRKSPQYTAAYAEYLKTGDDTQCRSLLSENASGTVPVATYVEDRIRTAWERDGIMRLVKKSYMKGNVKIGWEKSADDAYEHTEGSGAVTEESLVLDSTSLIAKSAKKWISTSDEVLDLKPEAFLDYVVDEITYRVAKKTADGIIADIEACSTVSTTDHPAVGEITSTTITVGLVAEALAELSDEAENPVIILNKKTWGALKKAQAANHYGYDPFEGLQVIYNNKMKAFSAATTGVTYMIVGDLGLGAQVNFPSGSDEIEIKIDTTTKMEEDLVRILGRRFVGHGVVAPLAFCKVKH